MSLTNTSSRWQAQGGSPVALQTLTRTPIFVGVNCLNPKVFIAHEILLAGRQRGVPDSWAMGRGKAGDCWNTLLKTYLKLVQNQTNMNICNMISCKYRLESCVSLLVTVPFSRSWDLVAWCDHAHMVQLSQPPKQGDHLRLPTGTVPSQGE